MATPTFDFTSGSLPSGASVTRASLAMLFDSSGKITYAPNNLLTYSEQIDNTAWSKGNYTVAVNATAAPDGNTAADKVVEIATTTANHFVYQALTIPAAGRACVSIFAKGAERKYLLVSESYSNVGKYFDLVNGVTMGNLNSNVPVASGIQSYGNGWYRCWIVVNIPATIAQPVYWPSADGISNSNAGDGLSGQYLWGAQFEMLTYQALPSAYTQVVTSPYHGPRFDYNASSLTLRGPLDEAAATNLATYSDQFDNAAWTNNGMTVIANAATSPDGNVMADLVYPSSTGTIGNRRILKAVSGSVGQSYTASIFAKASGKRWVFFSGPDATSASLNCYFDLQTGVVGTKGSAITAASIVAYPNGWYRITVSAVATQTGQYVYFALADADNSAAITANSTDGAYFWGAQLEMGTVATSYIATGGSPAARAAESLSLNWSVLGVANGTCYTRVTYDDLSTNIISGTVVSGSQTIAPTQLARPWVRKAEYLMVPTTPPIRAVSFIDPA